MHHRSPARPVPGPRRLLAHLTCALLLLGGLATAQDAPLETIAPPDAWVAVGFGPSGPDYDALAEDLDALDWEGAREGWTAVRRFAGSAEDAADDLISELAGPFLGGVISDALEPLFDAADPDGAGPPSADELRDGLEGICAGAGDAAADLEKDHLDDLLLTVSASSGRPMPAGTVLARMAPDGREAAASLFERIAACSDGEPLVQDGHDIVVFRGGDLPLALSHVEGTFVVATDPEAVRGVLRRLDGADEPSLADGTPGSALAEFERGGLRLAIDGGAIAEFVDSMIPDEGGPPVQVMLLDRALDALRTIDGLAVRAAATETGLAWDSVTTVAEDGPDAELAALLRCDGCEPPAPRLIPPDPVSASGRTVPIRDWVAYLDGWMQDAADAGAPVPADLATLAEGALGLDLDTVLLDWVGDESEGARLAAISPDLRDLIHRPARVSSVSVRSASAAEEGLDALFAHLETWRQQAEEGELGDAELAGMLAQLAVRERTVGEASYRRVQIGPTVDLAIGVLDDRLVVASPAATFDRVAALAADDGAARFPGPAAEDVLAELPDDRTAWSYGRPGADLIGLADTLGTFTQPLAGALAAVFAVDTGADETPTATAETEAAPAPAPMASGTFETGGIEPAPLELPATVEGELDGGGAATVDGDEVDVYRVTGLAPGTVVSVEMTSDPVDTYLYHVEAGGGTVFASDDDSPDTDRSALTVSAPESGEIWIAAGSFAGFGTGPYTITLERAGGAEGAAPAGPFDPNAIQPEPLDVPGSIEGELGDGVVTVDGRGARVFRLEGAEPGTRLQVVMTADEVDTYLYRLHPGAAAILGANDDAGSFRRSELVFDVPESGETWIAASSWSGREDGAFRLEISVQASTGEAEASEADASEADTSEADTSEAEPSEAEPSEADVPEEDVPEEDAPPPPTFAELLPLLEIGPDVLRTIGEHLGTAHGWSTSEDGWVRSSWRLEVDW